MMGLRGMLVRVRLRIVEIDVRGEGRLMRGEALRGVGIVRCGVGRGIDRDGVERCGIELRLLREGMVRWGVVGREIDREGDRLGADRVICRMAWLPLLRELRELRRAAPPSLTRARNRTTPATDRSTALKLGVFFTRYIVDLLSSAVFVSGDPGFPSPHYRRIPTRHVRSYYPEPPSFAQDSSTDIKPVLQGT
jgi:hypothetical protein